MGFGPLLEDKLCLIFKLAPSVCRMTFPILASLLVRLVVLLPFQLLRLSLATTSRWTPLALSVFFYQAEAVIRDLTVTGVQTCALPIFRIGEVSQHPPDTSPIRMGFAQQILLCSHSNLFGPKKGAVVGVDRKSVV